MKGACAAGLPLREKATSIGQAAITKHCRLFISGGEATHFWACGGNGTAFWRRFCRILTSRLSRACGVESARGMNGQDRLGIGPWPDDHRDVVGMRFGARRASWADPPTAGKHTGLPAIRGRCHVPLMVSLESRAGAGCTRRGGDIRLRENRVARDKPSASNTRSPGIASRRRHRDADPAQEVKPSR
jgi:hypothetical protein